MQKLIFIIFFVATFCYCSAQNAADTSTNVPPAKAYTTVVTQLQKAEMAFQLAQIHLQESKQAMKDAKIKARVTGGNAPILEAEGNLRRATQAVDMAEKAVHHAKFDALPLRKIVFDADIFLWSPILKVEGRVYKSVTIGALMKFKFVYFTGGKIEPFVRYYFKNKAPSGLFLQAKGSVGLYHTRILANRRIGYVHHDETKPELPNLPYTTFQTYGGGIATGYQMLVGAKKHGILEFYGGIQVIVPNVGFLKGYAVHNAAIITPVEIGFRLGGAF